MHGSRLTAYSLAALFAALAIGGVWLSRVEYRSALAFNALEDVQNATDAAVRDQAWRRAESVIGNGPTGALYEMEARLALLQDPPDAGRAERAARLALQRSPAREEPWTQLAYLDAVSDDGLGPEGLADFNRSFVATPYAISTFQLWRIRFALNQWDRMDDEARAHVARAAQMLPRRPQEQFLKSLPDTATPEAEAFLRERLDAD